MFHTLLVYVHLLATCVALGSILGSDIRMLGRLRRADFRLAPPSRGMIVIVAVSLVVLVETGAALIVLGMQQRPDVLANPKLQAKIALVALLALNAIVLHRSTFPWLARGRRIKPLSARVMLGVALPAAVSLALWLYAAFLGVARPWNFSLQASTVLGIAGACVAVAWIAAMGIMHIAAHRQRTRRAARRAAPTVPAEPWPDGATDAQRVATAVLDKARRGSYAHRAAPALDPLLRTRPRDVITSPLDAAAG